MLPPPKASACAPEGHAGRAEFGFFARNTVRMGVDLALPILLAAPACVVVQRAMPLRRMAEI